MQAHLEPSELGPLTAAIADTQNGTQPPALVREWDSRLASPDDVVLLWAASTKGLSWWSLHSAAGTRQAPVRSASPAKVERLLSPLAHEGRVTILQALYAGPLGSTALTETTGFEGGRLYHHLRELRYAGYVTQEQGKYRLTQLGRELLITVTLIAEQAIVDRGEEGLAAGEAWVGQ